MIKKTFFIVGDEITLTFIAISLLQFFTLKDDKKWSFIRKGMNKWINE